MAEALRVLKAVYTSFNDDKAMRLASSISFATIFALTPLLVLTIAIAGAFLAGGNQVAEQTVFNILRSHVGSGAASALRQLVEIGFDRPRESFIAQVAGWVTFAIGASGLFGTLQDALNSVWHIEVTKGGWKQLLRDRIASFAMIVVIAFLLLVSFAANTAIAYVTTHYLSVLPIFSNATALEVGDGIVMFAIVTLTFAAVFKVLPDVSLSWRDVWSGAVVTAVLFLAGEGLISLYMSIAGVGSWYGAAGSLLVAQIWIYYSAMILLLGAEFTKVQAQSARTRVSSGLREIVSRPAGVDPRRV